MKKIFWIALAALLLLSVYYMYFREMERGWDYEFNRNFKDSHATMTILRRDYHFTYGALLIEIESEDLQKCILKDKLIEVTYSKRQSLRSLVTSGIKLRGTADFDVDNPRVRLFIWGEHAPKNRVAYDPVLKHALLYMDGSIN